MTFDDDRNRSITARTILLVSGGGGDGLQAITYSIVSTGRMRVRRGAGYGEEDMGDRLKEKVALVSGAGSSGPGLGQRQGDGGGLRPRRSKGPRSGIQKLRRRSITEDGSADAQDTSIPV
jgi:hypothetical protein